MNTLTIGILTLNESKRIASCIKSASFADEVIVFDSGSSDNTATLAREAGAKVFVDANWQGFAEQRNRLLTQTTSEYIFFLDADEEITPELKLEIIDAVAQGEQAVWEVQWDQVAFGRTLTKMKSTGGVQRLFQRKTIMSFEGVVHEGAITNPSALPIHTFKNKLVHHSRETIHDSLLKLAQYSQLGALKRKQSGKAGGIWRGFLSGIGNFIRLYIVRRGFLCGAQGFLYCLFVALECYFRYVALKYDANNLNNSVKR